MGDFVTAAPVDTADGGSVTLTCNYYNYI
jgi:hypothetical protein